MSKVILILGDTGRGKSVSIENLPAESTALINVVGKELPFQNANKKYQLRNVKKETGNVWVKNKHEDIVNIMKGIDSRDYLKHFDRIVIDDFQYTMSYEFMDRAKETGYSKFTEIAQHAFKIIDCAKTLERDIFVYILAHTDTEVDKADNLRIRMKTVGRMLDNQITVEGLFSIVLFADMTAAKTGNEYFFITQTDGRTTAKSPKGMFKDLKIPNDLAFVEKSIIQYYE